MTNSLFSNTKTRDNDRTRRILLREPSHLNRYSYLRCTLLMYTKSQLGSQDHKICTALMTHTHTHTHTHGFDHTRQIYTHIHTYTERDRERERLKLTEGLIHSLQLAYTPLQIHHRFQVLPNLGGGLYLREESS